MSSPPHEAPAEPLPAVRPAPTVINCVHCGALNELSFGQCIRCGMRLQSTPNAAEQPEIQGPSLQAPTYAARTASDPTLPVWASARSGDHLFATKFFVIVTFLVFAGQVMAALERGAYGALLMGSNPIDDIRFGAMMVNYPPIAETMPNGIVAEEPWRMLSSVFVHFGLVHFGFNMFALVQLARLAEPAIGSVRFTICYVLSGLGGFAMSLAYAALTGEPMLTAGASGAIFGVMGLILGFLIRRKDPRWKTWAVQAVFYSLVFGVMLKANNTAHVGGLVIGALFGALFAQGAPRDAQRWQIVLAGVCLAACLLSLVLPQLSPVWTALQTIADSRPGAI